MARRFGSAMIANADSTLLIYSTEHMRVKVYNDGGASHASVGRGGLPPPGRECQADRQRHRLKLRLEGGWSAKQLSTKPV